MNDKVAVLVVEDDQLIQALVEDALSEGGFQATITASGEEAVRLLRNENQFRAVVSDINLSGKLTGWDVARSAREIDHTIPTVYMTGTHAEDWSSKGVPNSVLLIKPFAPAQLVTAISNLLNEAGTMAPPTD